MPDNRLNIAYKTLRENDGDTIILNEIMDNYGNEFLNNLETQGEDLLEGLEQNVFNPLLGKSSLATPTPTLDSEQINSNLRATDANSVSTVMRPDVTTKVDFEKNIFDGIGFRINDISELELQKKLTEGKTTSLYTNLHDKSVGLTYQEKSNLGYKFKLGAEYSLSENETALSATMSNRIVQVGGKAYLGENTGINVWGRKNITKASYVKASVSVFQDGSAFNINFHKTFDKSSQVSLGVYGSTSKKEIGVKASMYL